jgi:predicted TIM-barrel fold metal-dependent hydrolase
MLRLTKRFSGGIFDAHLHLDDQLGGTADHAAQKLVDEMQGCGVGHAVVLHLLWQPWRVEEVAEALAKQPMLTGFINVDPHSPTALSDLQRGHELGFRGLKLHPRVQKFYPDDAACIELVERAGELGMPALIDCFPDGDWLMAGLTVRQYATLAREAPRAKVIVAHAAGHHCLDLLMLAKRVPNLWFDLSYSLLYYGGPVVESLLYCLRSIRCERVTFGTDCPDRPLKESIKMSLAVLDRYGVAGDEREKLLWKNACKLLLEPSASPQMTTHD